MGYEEFKDYILKHIKDYLSDDFKDATVSLEKTNKVNITRDGLMVRRENAEITPTLYLDGLYKDYLGGKDMHIILSEMAEIYMGDAPGFDLKSLLDKEYVMNNLCIRIINKEWNAPLLEDAPYTDLGDFAITYHVEAYDRGGNCGSYMIKNTHLESLDMTEEDLRKMAVEGCETRHPAVVQDMREVLAEMMGDDFMYDQDDELSNTGFYVVSNDSRIYGAAVLAYDGTLEEISKIVGGDFVILPSSVHELLVMKDDGSLDYSAMTDMVKDVNSSSVDRAEQLGDCAYHYDSKAHVMERCDDYVARKELENTKGKSLSDQLKAGEKMMEGAAKPKTPAKSKNIER